MASMVEVEASAFEAVTTGYYRRPDVAQAAQAMRHALRMMASAERSELGRFGVLMYLFARIAQTSDAARKEFAPLLQSYRGPHVALAETALEAGALPNHPAALRVGIARPEDLDLLWAEFFVTGAPDPVLRIIATLDREDVVRRHLERWLHKRSLFDRGRRRATASTLDAVGIALDLDRRVIITSGDLDCLCCTIARRPFPIFQHLELAPEDALQVAIKGSALWSLQLNSTVHELVAALCHQESQRLGGPARRELASAQPGPAFQL